MASARRVVIEFLGQDKSLSSTASKAEGRMSKLGGKMKAVGKIAATGLAAGVAVAGVALFKMGQAAIEDAAGQARLAKAMQNAAGASKQQVAATEEWISAQGTALGVADDQLRPALEKLVIATGDVGKAQKLASMAMDISAGTGMSLEMVSKSLAKAQNGQVAGLSRLGISTKNAAGETISFEQAQKRLAKAHGGQAATSANTLEGKINRLKLILSETGETIGAKLIPYVTKMADWFLAKGLPAIMRFGNYLQTTLPPIFARIRTVVASVMAAVKGDVGGNLTAVKQIFANAVSIIRSVWNSFGSGILQFLRSTFENVKTVLTGAFTVIQGIFKTVSALLKGDWKGVWDGIKTILRGAVQVLVGIVRQLWTLIRFAFRSAGTALRALMRGIWSGIQSIISNGAEGIVNAVKAIPGKLGALGRLFANAGKGLLQGFINGMKNAAGIITGIAGNVWDAVKGLLNGAIEKINRALEFRIDKGPINIGINPPDIPKLAKGGIVQKRPGGILANIGEGRYDEAVIPLSPANKRAMAGGGSGGGNTIVNIYGALDPVAVGRQVEKVLIQYSRATNRPVQVKTL